MCLYACVVGLACDRAHNHVDTADEIEMGRRNKKAKLKRAGESIDRTTYLYCIHLLHHVNHSTSIAALSAAQAKRSKVKVGKRGSSTTAKSKGSAQKYSVEDLLDKVITCYY